MPEKKSKKTGKKELINLGKVHQIVGKAVIIELASANLPPLDSVVLLPNNQPIGPIVDFIGSVKHPWAVVINKFNQPVTIGVKVKARPALKKKTLKKSFSRKNKGQTKRPRKQKKSGK